MLKFFVQIFEHQSFLFFLSMHVTKLNKLTFVETFIMLDIKFHYSSFHKTHMTMKTTQIYNMRVHLNYLQKTKIFALILKSIIRTGKIAL